VTTSSVTYVLELATMPNGGAILSVSIDLMGAGR
jgi:hypothetical protein